MILDNEWRQELAERISEEMTFLLLDASNPNSESDVCACLTCLSKIAIDMVMDSLVEKGDEQMLKQMHENNIQNNNVN